MKIIFELGFASRSLDGNERMYVVGLPVINGGIR